MRIFTDCLKYLAEVCILLKFSNFLTFISLEIIKRTRFSKVREFENYKQLQTSARYIMQPVNLFNISYICGAFTLK